jgi:hypothetical protein
MDNLRTQYKIQVYADVVNLLGDSVNTKKRTQNPS